MLGIVSLIISFIPFVGPLLTRPRLQVTRTYADVRSILADGQAAGQAAFTHARFRNQPLLPWLVDTKAAIHLQARLSFFADDSANRVLGPLVGRWGDADQPASLSPFRSILDIEQITLAPNGAPRELDIALKHGGQAECYAVDNGSFRFSGVMNPQYRLPGGQYLVQVELVADNFGGYRKWFLLHNRGSQATDLNIEEAEPPSWHRSVRNSLD